MWIHRGTGHEGTKRNTEVAVDDGIIAFGHGLFGTLYDLYVMCYGLCDPTVYVSYL
jgi:hypothetical protein